MEMSISCPSLETGWLDSVAGIVNEIKGKAENATNMPYKLLLVLAKNAEKYLQIWKTLGKEIRTSEAQSVGSYMVRVLKKAHELVSCVGKGHEPSPGEFAEIIDDFSRYATMMNRMMNKISKNSSLRELHDKVENDCAVLLSRLLIFQKFAFRQTPHLPEVCYNNLNIPESCNGILGYGSYAKVQRAKWEGSEVAVKIFHNQEGEDFEDLPDFKAELVRLKYQALDSSHILKLLGRSKNGAKEVFLILELMDEDLQRRNEDQSKPSLSVPDLVEIIIQIAKGMRFLHSQNIVHRDLKPGNILLRQKDEDRQCYLVKLADFGKCKGNFCDYTPERGGHGNLEEAAGHDHTLNQGTLKYMAPEMKSKDDYEGKYTRLVDVFSFGTTCADLVSQTKHPGSLKKLIWHSKLEDPLRRPCFEVICEELWLVMQELLARESISLPLEPPKDSSTSIGAIQPQPEAENVLLTGLEVLEVGGQVKVSFKLVGLYCVTTWMRTFFNGSRAFIIKTERSNGPAERIEHQYKIKSEDVGNAIKILICVQYRRWCVTTSEVGNGPVKFVMKEVALHNLNHEMKHMPFNTKKEVLVKQERGGKENTFTELEQNTRKRKQYVNAFTKRTRSY